MSRQMTSFFIHLKIVWHFFLVQGLWAFLLLQVSWCTRYPLVVESWPWVTFVGQHSLLWICLSYEYLSNREVNIIVDTNTRHLDVLKLEARCFLILNSSNIWSLNRFSISAFIKWVANGISNVMANIFSSHFLPWNFCSLHITRWGETFT